MRIRYLRALKRYEEVGCWRSFLLTCHVTLNKSFYLFLGFLPCKVSGWTLRSFQLFSLSPVTLCLDGQLISQVNYSIGPRSCLWCWTSVRWAPGSHLVVNSSWLFSALPGTQEASIRSWETCLQLERDSRESWFSESTGRGIWRGS